MVLRSCVWLQHPTLLRGFLIKSTNYIQVRWYTSQCWTTLGLAMRNYVPILWVTWPCRTNMKNGWCLKKVFIGQPQYSSRLDMVGKHIHKYSRYQNLNMHIQDRIQIPSQSVKTLSGFFLCISSSLTCLKKPVFNNGDLLRWNVPARLYWDLLTSWRYPPACHYF